MTYDLQALHFNRHGPHGGNQRENSLSTGWPDGRSHSHYTNPMIPRAMMAYQEHILGYPSYPTSYVDGFHGPSQGRLSNTSLPHLPPGSHHTPSPPLISGHPAVNFRGAHNSEVPRGFPLLVRQAVQGFVGVPTSSIQLPALSDLSPQAENIDVLPVWRRPVHSFPCLVPRCPSSFSRAQDQRRHLLIHLPRWIHCPAPDCSWRGDRLSAFARHWGRDHPSSSQVPEEDQCKIFDPLPLMKGIADGSVCIQDAQKYAVSMVKKKASILGKPELFENPWGRKQRKQRKAR